MQLYISWFLLLLAVLSVLYGYTQYRSVAAMAATERLAWFSLPATALSGAVLTIVWCATGFPLPIFYILAYLFRAARLLGSGPVQRKDLFLLNLGFVNTMTLHLILIGGASLVQGVAMHTLLASGFWRTMSAAVVLTADMAENLVFLRWPNLPGVLSAEAESVEARPFMAFLWFCTGYVLADSILCVAKLEPLYPPLFLVGSVAIVMYYIIRFLLHINTIIRDEYLMEEHDRLSIQLAAAREHTGTLKRIVDRDALTGAFSRRHIMARINTMVEGGAPFCLAFLDLDGLKRINDSQGHAEGDRYLIGFTQAMEVRIREEDLLARVGGDEFVVLMPGCDAQTASRRMEGIRSVLETRSRGGTVFRFSYGVSASLPGDGRNADALLQEADRAMYLDKKRRR